MEADVFRYLGREDGLCLGALGERGANLRCRNIFLKVGQEVELGRASGSAADIDADKLRLVVQSLLVNALGKRGGDLLEQEAGPRGDDEVAKEDQLGGAVPALEGKEGIGSEQTEEIVGGRQSAP